MFLRKGFYRRTCLETHLFLRRGVLQITGVQALEEGSLREYTSGGNKFTGVHCFGGREFTGVLIVQEGRLQNVLEEGILQFIWREGTVYRSICSDGGELTGVHVLG